MEGIYGKATPPRQVFPVTSAAGAGPYRLPLLQPPHRSPTPKGGYGTPSWGALQEAHEAQVPALAERGTSQDGEGDVATHPAGVLIRH